MAHRGEEDVAALVLGVGDVGGEVRGAFRELLIHAVVFAESINEEVAQTAGVVVTELCQAVGLGSAERTLGKVCEDSALERIQEADAEVNFAVSSDLGVGAGDADGRDARIGKGVAGGDGNAGAVGAEHQGNAVGDQILGMEIRSWAAVGALSLEEALSA